ncbi:Uncharacterized protein TCM_014963 [Theobroma cacao]|uniref:Uncharacterized protein n=1 Tax=Theobroma cacao TaxID=3641 RepID=A0A061G7B0_THECC|nr:Uncharacterized protein TCM_014963 [Theobroma cacao]
MNQLGKGVKLSLPDPTKLVQSGAPNDVVRLRGDGLPFLIFLLLAFQLSFFSLCRRYLLFFFKDAVFLFSSQIITHRRLTLQLLLLSPAANLQAVAPPTGGKPAQISLLLPAAKLQAVAPPTGGKTVQISLLLPAANTPPFFLYFFFCPALLAGSRTTLPPSLFFCSLVALHCLEKLFLCCRFSPSHLYPISGLWRGCSTTALSLGTQGQVPLTCQTRIFRVWQVREVPGRVRPHPASRTSLPFFPSFFVHCIFSLVSTGTNTWDRFELRIHKRLIDLYSNYSGARCGSWKSLLQIFDYCTCQDFQISEFLYIFELNNAVFYGGK